MKSYCCSIIACSKNHDEKMINIDLRLIQVFSERIGGLIGGHFLQISGKNLYVFGTLDGRLFGLEIVASGIIKYQINIGNTDFEDGNFLLSIEKSRNGIFLMSSSGNIVEIKNS